MAENAADMTEQQKENIKELNTSLVRKCQKEKEELRSSLEQ